MIIDDATRLPYPGLRSFRRDETDLFFGREGSVDRMIDRLANSRFLAVLGASGTGKSSLVRTGLLDALELGLLTQAGPRWRIVDTRPGSGPIRNLAAAMLRSAPHPSPTVPDEREVNLLSAHLSRGPRSIVEWCRAGHLAERSNLLILVDQFEELFRYRGYTGREEAEAFVALLLESRRTADVPVHVVITMRSEYLGACALIDGLADAINEGQFLTPRMTRAECEAAIVGPAEVCGGIVKPDLLSQIMNDLASFAPWETTDGGDEVTRLDRLARRADQLPLLQHVLNRLWRVAPIEAGRRVLQLDAYNEIEGLFGALDRHAEEVLTGLASTVPVHEFAHVESVAQRVFRTLTVGTSVADAVRRPTRFCDLVDLSGGDKATVRRVLDAFRHPDCGFLLPAAPLAMTSSVFVDISHESLIRQWRRLGDWVTEEADDVKTWHRLVDAAQAHAEERGDLLRGQGLRTFVDWFETVRPSSTWARIQGIPGEFDTARDYLEASRAAEDERRRQEEEKRQEGQILREASIRAETKAAAERRTARITMMGLVLSIVLVLVAFAGFWTAREARDAAQNSLGLANLERERALVAERQSRLDQARVVVERIKGRRDDPDTALAIGLEALDINAPNDPPDALVAPHVRTIVADLLGSVELQAVHGNSAWSKDATHAAISDGNVLDVINTRSGLVRRITYLAKDPKPVSIDLSDNGQQTGLSFPGGLAMLVSNETGTLIDVIQAFNESMDAVTMPALAITADGRRMAVTPMPGANRLLIVDLASRTIVGNFLSSGGGITSAAFAPDDGTLLVGFFDGTARLLDGHSGQQRRVLSGHRDTVRSVSFSPDGRSIATASDDKTVRIWDADNGREIAVLKGHDDWVNSVAFSPDGLRLVTGSDDNLALIWDIAGGVPVQVLKGHTSNVRVAAFSPDGKRIATGSDDGSVIHWTADGYNRIATIDVGKPVGGVAFHPDGDRLLVITDTVNVFWISGEERSVSFTIDGTAAIAAAFSANGRLLTASRQGRIWSWFWSEDEFPGEIIIPGADAAAFLVRRMHPSVDWTVRLDANDSASSVAVAGRTAGSLVWIRDGTARFQKLSGDVREIVLTSDVTTAVFDPKERFLVTGRRDGSVKLWSAVDGHLIADLAFTPLSDLSGGSSVTQRTQPVNARSSREIERQSREPDSEAEAVAPTDKQSVAAPPSARNAAAKASAIRSATFSRDGGKLAVVGADGLAATWDLVAGTGGLPHNDGLPILSTWSRLLVRPPMSDDSDPAPSVSFSHDAYSLAIVWKNELEIVETRSGATISSQVTENRFHRNVSSAVYSPIDNEMLIAAGPEGLMRIMVLGSGRTSLSRDSLWIQTASIEDLRDIGRALSRRDLTDDEARTYLPASVSMSFGSTDQNRETRDEPDECELLAGHRADPKRRGIGVKFDDIDTEAAIRVCSDAVQSEPLDARSRFHLGRALFRERRFAEGFAEYEKAASAGYPIALNNLAYALISGEGTDVDLARGEDALRRALALSVGVAGDYLAAMLWDGDWEGTKGREDREEAISIWRHAAEAGSARSYLKLAEIFEKGQFVDQDLTKALVNWILAERTYCRESLPNETEARRSKQRRQELAALLEPVKVIAAIREADTRLQACPRVSGSNRMISRFSLAAPPPAAAPLPAAAGGVSEPNTRIPR
jgi:WD40 repeat protein